MAEQYRGCGIGDALMREILSLAKTNPKIHTVISLIEGSNETSIHLHEKHGFTYCGQIKQVGYKFDKWLDLNTYQLHVYE